MTFVLAFGVFSIVPGRAQAGFDPGQLIDPLCLFACKNKQNNVTTTYNNSNNVNSNINSPNATVNVANSATPVVAYNSTPVYNYGYSYNYPTNYNNYGPLNVNCYPMPLSARTGDTVSWSASAYGGNNSYYYTWTGTDGLSGYGSAISKTYYSSGYKNASVTVTSNGQTISKNCDGSVNVYGDYYNNYPNYNYNNYPQNYNYYPSTYYSQLYVTCAPSNQYSNAYGNSITWNAYPSGGNGYYTYYWTGTDNLYGSSQSLYYSYSYPGVKTASVTVYSNGQSITQSCGSATVGNNYGYVNNYNNYAVVNNNGGLDVACYVDPTTARTNQPVTWKSEVTGGVAPYTYTWTGTNGLSGSNSTVTKYYDTAGEKNAILNVKSADGRTSTSACTTALTVRAATVATPARPAVPAQPVVNPKPAQPDNNGLSAAALFSFKNVPWGWVAILVIIVLFATVVYLIFNRPKI
ncbi:MAG: hypothetical protein RL536_599 [Candidatus Parcubacteria bacterium]